MHKSYMCPHWLNIEGAEEERTTNAYTPGWFDTFLRAYWPEQTAREVDFLSRQLPLPAYRDVLDVCCGAGRHALPLAARGHRVTGLDRDERMLSQARREAAAAAANGGGATFVSGDMRELAAAVSGAFDAAICMWQSFGYFDAATNADVLRQMREALRPGGRLILDLYNRDAFSEGSGAETTERAGRAITTTQTLAGDRLSVAIDYGGDLPRDTFEWQIFTPAEIAVLAETFGLRPLLACAWADERIMPSRGARRMEVAFERGA
jgi:SAM-dependent methyltransferase